MNERVIYSYSIVSQGSKEFWTKCEGIFSLIKFIFSSHFGTMLLYICYSTCENFFMKISEMKFKGGRVVHED